MSPPTAKRTRRSGWKLLLSALLVIALALYERRRSPGLGLSAATVLCLLLWWGLRPSPGLAGGPRPRAGGRRGGGGGLTPAAAGRRVRASKSGPPRCVNTYDGPETQEVNAPMPYPDPTSPRPGEVDWDRLLAQLIPRQQAVILAAMSWIAEPLSPAMLADVLERTVELGTIAYHVKRLEARGIVSLAGTRRKRGATEHLYRLRGE